ncbi:hypothetical protein BS35_002040 [Actinomadura glauciflava]|nr:hypothetical protein [Actinomadura glauciflava]
MNGSMPDHDRSTGTGLQMQHVGIAVAVGAVLLGLLVAVAIAVTPDDDGGGPDKRGAAAPPRSTTKAPSAPAGSAAPKPSPTITAPVVRWRGMVLLDGPRSRRDLDAKPPRLSKRDGEPDIRGNWLGPTVEADSDAQVALMRPRSEPSAVQCRDAAAAEGSDEVEVDEDDVVCVSTTAGRVARLTIVDAHSTTTSPIVRARVVIWDMPRTGQ